MTKFEEVVGIPNRDGTAGETPEAQPPQKDGRLPTIYGKSEAGFEAHLMEVSHAELHGDKEQLEATPFENIYTVPTHMIPDNSALVTVAGEKRGHLSKWGHPRIMSQCAPRSKFAVAGWTQTKQDYM
eukprot:5781246-Pyramimonas_sp.AAC.1